MSLHQTYKHLLGIPYRSGVQDCYGLVRRYFKEFYQLDLANFARPDGWWNDPSIDLINESLHADGWQNIGINLRSMRIGDALVFSLINGRANHVGIYVGNGMFIHHVYNRFSSEDALMDKWTSRLLMIVRHPKVSPLNTKEETKTDFMSLLPEHVRAKIIRSSQP